MSDPAKLRAAVFDLDGTLVDSMPLVFAAIAHAIEPYGPPRAAEDIFPHLGGPPERFLSGLLGGEKHVPAAMARMAKFHHESQHLIAPFAGARESLEALRARGVALALWTGRDRESGERLLHGHGLREMFATIVYGDDLPTHKPDPQGLREILRRLAVAPSEAIFIGDAEVDVLGGVGADVRTVLITHQREVNPAVRMQAWRVVETPDDALKILLNVRG